MDVRGICELMQDLGSGAPDQAWVEFLERYSPVLQQVVRLTMRGDDAQADCFVFVCEQLAANQFRRLRKFRLRGSASFATWLRAVTRNLCLDWQRKAFGRRQTFKWVKKLSPLEQQVFRYVHEDESTSEQAFAFLSPLFPGLTLAAVEQSALHLGTQLSVRERWLLNTRAIQLESLDRTRAPGESGRTLQVRDLAPDPERTVIEGQDQETLQRALRGLNQPEQLLLRMRFEQDLTLQEIARITGLKDAQAADRALHLVLEQMRQHIGRLSPHITGKTKVASV
jgi:RNA polymerase sigma factor (sigma-70 family)